MPIQSGCPSIPAGIGKVNRFLKNSLHFSAQARGKENAAIRRRKSVRFCILFARWQTITAGETTGRRFF
ncbi:MAG: hypothetical protein U0O29_02315 [Oscillospiraceae bacterium]